MDNLTHSLVGLAAARAGLDRTSPYASAMCVIAANAPDADIVMLMQGQWAYLEHHRGITHSIAGVAVIALLLPVLFWTGDRVIAAMRGRALRTRFGGLLITSLILSASHPLLDWTNSYGLRPFLPWRREWFYGDLVFIIDPWLWLSVGGTAFLLSARTKRHLILWVALGVVLTSAVLFLPQRAGMPYPLLSRALWLAGLAGLATLYLIKAAARWGRSVPAVALALVVVYWGALAVAHRRALTQAQTIARQSAGDRGETLLRVVAMPVLADPSRWLCIFETDRALTRFHISLRSSGESVARANETRFEKPRGVAAEAVARAAASDERARIFLDFARFPATQIRRDCVGETLVQFADLRFTQPGSGERRGGFAVDIPVPPAPE